MTRVGREIVGAKPYSEKLLTSLVAGSKFPKFSRSILLSETNIIVNFLYFLRACKRVSNSDIKLVTLPLGICTCYIKLHNSYP